jgi:hypothetical protein
MEYTFFDFHQVFQPPDQAQFSHITFNNIVTKTDRCSNRNQKSRAKRRMRHEVLYEPLHDRSGGKPRRSQAGSRVTK